MSAGPFIHDSSVQTVPFSSYAPRVAVVSGAAQGIGYAIPQRLADDGLDVAGRRAIAVPGDVSSEADVICMVERTATELGSVDVMIANAGIPAIASFLETSGEMFDSVYAVNVRGVFFCFKHAALQMIKQGRGGRLTILQFHLIVQSQINFLKLRARTPNLTAYSASKFAVRGLTQTASIELRRHGITANSYASGYIRTILDAVNDNVDDNIDTVKKLFGAPDAPVSEADTIESIVSYLAKPEAYFINGQSINVDGGLRYD
ncbi:hypothetical protein ACEPAH_8094 [Sanghuangporus vaninii]